MELVNAKSTSEQDKKIYSKVLSAVERGGALIRKMMLFSRKHESFTLEPVNGESEFEAAKEYFDENESDINVVICNNIVGENIGFQVLSDFYDRNKNKIYVLMSSDDSDVLDAELESSGAITLVKKPCSSQDLEIVIANNINNLKTEHKKTG